MKVATFERRGFWPFRRWEQTGEFDSQDERAEMFYDALRPEVAAEIRWTANHSFIHSWMVWGTARRGRTIRFTFDDGRTFP